jgi:predicted  nucleic acid-binding Zn-ribbon protein
MAAAIAHAQCATLARQIGRLGDEIRLLTREVPLREGRLLELELQVPPNETAVQRVAEEIRLAREHLAAAETDLVELEQVFKANCRKEGEP